MTKFCKTSSGFESNNIKNEAVFARLPSKMESCAQSLPRKGEARSYEVLHLSPKIIRANLNI